MVLEPLTTQMPPEVFVRNAFSLAAFVLSACEYIRSIDEERRFIWRGPMNWVKGLYLVARYCGLVGSVTNILLIFAGPLSTYPNHIDDCRRYFTTFAMFACVPMFSIDAFSMIRIYVLYQRDFRIGAFAASLILTEAILVAASTSRAMSTVDFTPICQVKDTPQHVLYFAAWVVATQVALIGLTFHKLRSITGKLDASTVYLVIYQGMWLCFFVIVVMCSNHSYSVMMGTATPNVVSIWPAAISSSIFCRVILNLRRGARSSSPVITHKTELEMQFTSWFSSAEEGQELRSQDGTSILRRRFPGGGRVSQNGTQFFPPNHRESSPSWPQTPDGDNLEAGISLSDVGLQGALTELSSAHFSSSRRT